MTRAAPTPETVTLHIPFRVVKRGGRKEMQLPNGASQSRRTDNTLVKALARAFRWRRLLEAGEFASISELAAAENISRSYISRLLQLTLLAPDIAEAILGGRQEAEAMLPKFLQSLPVEWERQRRVLWGVNDLRTAHVNGSSAPPAGHPIAICRRPDATVTSDAGSARFCVL